MLVNRAAYRVTAQRSGSKRKQLLNSSEMWNDANGWWLAWPHAHTRWPITACMALVFAEFQATRPIAVLLSTNGRI